MKKYPQSEYHTYGDDKQWFKFANGEWGQAVSVSDGGRLVARARRELQEQLLAALRPRGQSGGESESAPRPLWASAPG
eukprot:8827358-Pyramimonas_sp.AAC.1